MHWHSSYLARFSYTQLRNGLVLSLIGLEVSFPLIQRSKSRKRGRINEGLWSNIRRMPHKLVKAALPRNRYVFQIPNANTSSQGGSTIAADGVKSLAGTGSGKVPLLLPGEPNN